MFNRRFGVSVAGVAVALGLAIVPAVAQDSRGCTIRGTEGNDVLTGTSADDVICAFGGNDTVYALAGNDTVYGGAGNDLIYGGPGADTLWGEGGSDEVWGKAGPDKIDLGGPSDFSSNIGGGGDGTDIITGSFGPDKLYSGPGGQDELHGLDGNDTLTGHRSATTRETIKLMRGGRGNDVFFSAGGRISAALGGGDDLAYGSPHRDGFVETINEDVEGAGGRDRIFAGGGNDEVYLNGGLDHGTDYIALGPGNDFVDNAGWGSIIYGGAGNDDISTLGEGTRSFGGPGNDSVKGDIAGGGPGEDFVWGLSIAYGADGDADILWAPHCYTDIDLDDHTRCDNTN